jgi:hypothetical protein
LCRTPITTASKLPHVQPLPAPRELVVDATSDGRPVVDLLMERGRKPLGVVITAGRAARREGALCYVPKSLLLRPLVSALENDRLKIAQGLPAGEALARELQAFRVGITRRGRAAYATAVGEHDDLVLAVALAVWRAGEK